jgi:hypothetical protein
LANESSEGDRVRVAARCGRVAALLWFYPYTPDGVVHGYPRCVPILEATRHYSPDSAMGAYPCYFGSVDRVTAGAVVGALLGTFGVVVLVAGRLARTLRRGSGVEPVRTSAAG